jgi:hypothetical protein
MRVQSPLVDPDYLEDLLGSMHHITRQPNDL